MGKALPKVCSICSKTIKGSNWARHAKTHKGVQVPEGKIAKGKITLKKGRPQKDVKSWLGDWKTVRSIKRRGMVLYGYKGTKLIRDDEMLKLANFVRLCVAKFRKGTLKGSTELI